EGHPAFLFEPFCVTFSGHTKTGRLQENPFSVHPIRRLSRTFASTQTQHVLHVVQRRRTLLQPQRRAHRPRGKGHAARGLVSDLHALAIGGEQHGVITHHVAGTHGGKTDGLALTRTGLTFTTIHGDLLQVTPQRLGHHFTHAQRSAGRRI